MHILLKANNAVLSSITLCVFESNVLFVCLQTKRRIMLFIMKHKMKPQQINTANLSPLARTKEAAGSKRHYNCPLLLLCPQPVYKLSAPALSLTPVPSTVEDNKDGCLRNLVIVKVRNTILDCLSFV